MAGAKFERVLVGNSLADAKQNGNYLTVSDLLDHLTDDCAGYYRSGGRFKACTEYFGLIFNPDCLPECQTNSPGQMTFVPPGEMRPHFKRNRVCKTGIDHHTFDCPSNDGDGKLSEKFENIEFSHQLVVGRNELDGAFQAKHQLLLPSIRAEVDARSPTFIYHPHRFDYQINQRFHQKFGNVVVIQGDDNGDEKFHVQSKWTLVNEPKDKSILKWRSEKLNIIFPSMKEPMWFGHVTSTSGKRIYSHCTNLKQPLALSPEAESLILYVPKAGFLDPNYMRDILKIPGVNILEWNSSGMIESKDGILFEFDSRNGVDLLKKNYDEKIRDLLIKMFISSGQSKHLALKLVPSTIKLKEASISLFYWDDSEKRLVVRNDGEGGKIQLHSDERGEIILGLLFTQSEKRMGSRTASLSHWDENNRLKQPWTLQDNGTGMVWIRATLSGHCKLVIQSNLESQMYMLIEVNKGQPQGSLQADLRTGKEGIPSKELMAQMIEGLSQEGLFIDSNLIDSIEALTLLSPESIAKETIRWAFNKGIECMGDGSVGGSILSRRARMAWYLLQSHYLADSEKILTMGVINDMLRYMPEYVRLPPDSVEDRWSRWTSRNTFVDDERSNGRGLALLVSPLPLAELKQLYPRIMDDEFGQRWMNPELAADHSIPVLSFQDPGHPLTSRTCFSAEHWMQELLHLVDHSNAWVPMEGYRWADDNFQTFSWIGADVTGYVEVFNPYVQDSFSSLNENPPPALNRLKDTAAPYLEIGSRKFRMIVRYSNTIMYGGQLEHNLFLTEINTNGEDFQYFKFGGSDLNRGIPNWIRDAMDDSYRIGEVRIRYMFEPDETRYMERETLRALTVLSLKNSNFTGLIDPRWKGRGLSGNVFNFFSNEDRTEELTFTPPYSQSNDMLAKRLLTRNWWKFHAD